MLSTVRRQKSLHHWQTNQQDYHARNTRQKLNAIHGSSNHKKNYDMTECKIPEHHFDGSVYETKSKADLRNFIHLACWSPCTSTTKTSIKSNLISTWPGINEQLVQKYLPKYEATAKGHIRQSFKGKQSTQPREPSETPSNNRTCTHIVYLQATNLAGKIYTDQTGWFPVTSSRG